MKALEGDKAKQIKSCPVAMKQLHEYISKGIDSAVITMDNGDRYLIGSKKAVEVEENGCE